ncbi:MULTISPECIES: hypothetical protein [unclassified Cryobacterium]|nr:MULTISPECIES: hypothetical protein [unclassified Cryobacterium]
MSTLCAKYFRATFEELVAEAGAELDTVDQVVIGDVAELIEPAGN